MNTGSVNTKTEQKILKMHDEHTLLARKLLLAADGEAVKTRPTFSITSKLSGKYKISVHNSN